MKNIVSFIFVAFLVASLGVNAEEPLSRVIDGDTLTISTVNHYRLAGIDAPEKGQDYGEESAKRMIELINARNLVYG